MRRTATLLCLLGCSGDPGPDDDTNSPTACQTPPCTTSTDPTLTTSSTTAPPTTDPAATTTGPPITSTTTTAPDDTTTPATTTTTTITTADDTTGTPVDCNNPPDCATCWACAREGACKAAYEACSFEAFCVPTLACFESMCLDDGVQQSCADTCCKSCANLGTCNGVNGALNCILPACAAQCGQVTCPG